MGGGVGDGVVVGEGRAGGGGAGGGGWVKSQSHRRYGRHTISVGEI